MIALLINFLFIFAGVALANTFDEPLATAGIMGFALLLAASKAHHNPNIVHLCLGLLAIKIIERCLFLFIPVSPAEGEPAVWVNNTIYLTHFAVDIVICLFLIYRGAISRQIQYRQGKQTKGIHLTLAEVFLLKLMLAFLFLDLLAAAENIIRNLEHVGASMEFAKQFWHWQWVFDNYSDWKRFLMGTEFLIIWLTITQLGQRERLGNGI